MIRLEVPKTEHTLMDYLLCVAVMMRGQTRWTLDTHEILTGIFRALDSK